MIQLLLSYFVFRHLFGIWSFPTMCLLDVLETWICNVIDFLSNCRFFIGLLFSIQTIWVSSISPSFFCVSCSRFLCAAHSGSHLYKDANHRIQFICIQSNENSARQSVSHRNLIMTIWMKHAIAVPYYTWTRKCFRKRRTIKAPNWHTNELSEK